MGNDDAEKTHRRMGWDQTLVGRGKTRAQGKNKKRLTKPRPTTTLETPRGKSAFPLVGAFEFTRPTATTTAPWTEDGSAWLARIAGRK